MACLVTDRIPRSKRPIVMRIRGQEPSREFRCGCLSRTLSTEQMYMPVMSDIRFLRERSFPTLWGINSRRVYVWDHNFWAEGLGKHVQPKFDVRLRHLTSIGGHVDGKTWHGMIGFSHRRALACTGNKGARADENKTSFKLPPLNPARTIIGSVSMVVGSKSGVSSGEARVLIG